MNKVEQQVNIAINQWGSNAFKGVGCIGVPVTLDARGIVLYVLQRFYNKTPTANSLILVNEYRDRKDIVNFLTHTDNEKNNEEFNALLKDKRLMVTSVNVYDCSVRFPTNKLVIVYNPTCYDFRHRGVLNNATFKLCILGRPFKDKTQYYDLVNNIPIINYIDANAVNELRTTSPVEEMYVPILIQPDSEDEEKLTKYNNYIRESISIFGDFPTLQSARSGDNKINKSALDVCKDLAYANGWNEHLDMSIPFNESIDLHFNPLTIKERADCTYNVIRERSVFLSDYVGKLKVIKEIVENHKNEKILIISKRGQFASNITDYLNINADCEICGDYHPYIDTRPATDDNGNFILVKTGAKKGQVKMIGAQAQSTLNEQKFNSGKIHILSINNAPSKDLAIDVDVVIITSPICEDIHAFMYRLDNVTFNREKLKLYSLYVKNTLEEQKLANKEIKENHVIVNRHEIINGSTNNFDFVVAD